MLRLAKVRKSKGLRQQDLATSLGVSRSTVAMWETGATNPDNNILRKLSHILGVSTDYLLGISEAPLRSEAEAIPPTFFRLAREAEKLGLTEKDVDAILNLYRQHNQDNED